MILFRPLWFTWGGKDADGYRGGGDHLTQGILSVIGV